MHHSLHPERRPASNTQVGESANPKVLEIMVEKEREDIVLSCTPVLASRGATVSRTPVRRVRQPENIRGHGYSLVMYASCSFQRGNHFSIPRSGSLTKRTHSPANHNLYSDEVLGGQPVHTHRRIPSKPLPGSTTEKTMVVLNPYFFAIPNPPLSHHTLSTFLCYKSPL